ASGGGWQRHPSWVGLSSESIIIRAAFRIRLSIYGELHGISGNREDKESWCAEGQARGVAGDTRTQLPAPARREGGSAALPHQAAGRGDSLTLACPFSV